MKRTFTKKLAVLLTIIAVLSCACIPALADATVTEREEIEKIEYFGERTVGYEQGDAIWKQDPSEFGGHDPGRTGYNLNDNEYDAERTGTLLEQTLVHYVDSIAAVRIKDETMGENGAGSYEIDAVKAETTAEVKAGVYRTKYGEDNAKQETFEPGFTATATTKVAALSGKAEGRLGTEDTNVHGAAQMEALTAKATAELDVGIVDGSVAAKLDAGVGANLFEIGGEIGVEYAGMEANLKGNLSLGINAGISAGYRDGKLSVKIGGSIGVGGSVGSDVDVRPVLNTMLGLLTGSYRTIEANDSVPTPDVTGGMNMEAGRICDVELNPYFYDIVNPAA